MDLLNYKCPCCGGGIEFNSAVQKMKCPFCDTEFDTETLKSFDEELKKETPDSMNWNTDAGSEWTEGEEEGIRVYVCQSCGGEIIGDESLAATSCPYCDNPVVMKGQFAGDLKPDLVVPFKFDKKGATEAYLNHLKGKKLLPRVFKDQNHIDEIKGIYVPFWLFDADAEASIRYKGTRVKRWSDANYNYTETSYFAIFRAGKLSFKNVPADGSSKIDDDLTESIEPYNMDEAVDFQTAYLSGYFADRYDVGAADVIDITNQRVKKSTERVFANTVSGYNSIETVNSNINIGNGKAGYALLPVWILNTTWNDKKYTFAMNGQTGKFVGNLPTDKSALFRWFAGICGAVTAVSFLIGWLLSL